MIKKTEQEIIRGCRKKDPYSQKLLVLQYSQKLMAVSFRYMKDHASAQDVLQESLIKILNAIPNYREEGSFEGWMRRIVVNTALGYFDKSCYKKEQLSPLEILPEQSISPDVYSQLAAEELMSIINQLPEGFRMIFNLFAVEGYSHKEIAELLKIKESTSRSQLTRARKMLVNILCKRDKIRVRI